MKLSPTMIALLKIMLRGDVIWRFNDYGTFGTMSQRHGDSWVPVKFSIATIRALLRRGLVRFTGGDIFKRVYAITDAGRKALEEADER